MRNVWWIVGALALVGCATSSSEQRGAQAAGAEGQQSATDPGAIDPERQNAIERTFARKAGDLQACWTKEYDKTHDRKLEGDLTIQMTVGPTGKASDVKIIKSTMNSASVEGCVMQMIPTWEFPEGPNPVPYLRTVHLGAQF